MGAPGTFEDSGATSKGPNGGAGANAEKWTMWTRARAREISEPTAAARWRAWVGVVRNAGWKWALGIADHELRGGKLLA